jgi:hypothetical protein
MIEKITKTQMIENIVKKLKTRKSKNIIYSLIVSFVVLCFGYRFYSVSQENNFDVFNIIRDNAQNGVPVNVLQMQKQDGILYEPLTIKNNRAYVSGARINVFKSGQKADNCKIISVSKNIDLDTGMHVIKTSNCMDGMHYVEIVQNGFFVPVSALHGNALYVVENDVAVLRDIMIGGRDAQNALITNGVQDGDIVILSDIKNGQKIKIVK